MDDNTVNTQAKNLTKAIFQHESGMNFDAKGDNGTSSGAGQWQPATWKAHAKTVLGDENAPMTKDNQSVVAQGMMRKWIKEGKNAAQIAAIWNSGSDKNWENKVGAKTYPDGTVIKYNVPKYVKEVTDLYHQYKGQTSQTPEQPQQETEQPKEGFLKSLVKGIVSPVATTLARPFQAGAELLGASAEDVNKAFQKIAGDYVAPVPQSGTDVLKDVGRAAQTVALGAPVGTVGQAVGAGVLAGAGSGLEQTGTLGGTIKGAAIGGSTGLIGGGISKALEKIPTKLTEGAFGLSPELSQKMLSEKSVGTTQGLLSQSEKSVSKSGNVVRNLIREADKAGVRGSGNDAIRQTLLDYPEFAGDKQLPKFVSKIKSLIRNTSGIESRGKIVSSLDKIVAGTATLEEKNLVRSAIDSATSGSWAKMAKALNPNAGHEMAMTLANNLRNEVKAWVPGSIPYFDELSKELAIKQALIKAAKKTEPLVGYRDVVPFMTGESLGGLPGAVAATAGRKVAGSPATRFALAKGVKGLSKVVNPVSSRAGLISTFTGK